MPRIDEPSVDFCPARPRKWNEQQETELPYILLIDSSARNAGSTTRDLANLLVARLLDVGVGTEVRCRDLAKTPPPFLCENWITACMAAEADRTPAQTAALAPSDELIDELAGAAAIVIGMPVYNFGIPASLKAWIDQVTRAERTFRSTAAGSEGLLRGKTVHAVVASAGVPIDSDYDFATRYLRHALAFIGITDLRVIGAGQQLRDANAVSSAAAAIAALGGADQSIAATA